MAVFFPQKYLVDYQGGAFMVSFKLTNEAEASHFTITYPEDYENSFSAEITGNTSTSCTIMVVARPNNSATLRKCTFYLNKYVTELKDPVTYIYTFEVAYNPAMILHPIWRDTYYVKNNINYLNYIIEDDTGNVVYSGTAISEPSKNDISFNVNHICANYLNSHLPNGITVGPHYVYDYTKLFTLKSDNQILAQFRFYNSYSYNSLPNRVFINDPIKRKMNGNTMIVEADKRQYTFVSAYNTEETAKSLKSTYTNIQGTTETVYEIDNTSMFVRIGGNYTTSVSSIIPSIVWNTEDINDGELQIKTIDTCYDYCLYYVNAYGGWDSLLIKGNTKKTDDVNSNYYIKTANNTELEFGKVKYLNEITVAYRLYTDWFNDDEQSRLYHLLESNEVYLHNLADNSIYPVNITNKQVEYKTFTNNGRKKWYNTIDVEVAQTKLRR